MAWDAEPRLSIKGLAEQNHVLGFKVYVSGSWLDVLLLPGLKSVFGFMVWVVEPRLWVKTPAGQSHRNQSLGFTGWLKRTIVEGLGLGRQSEGLGLRGWLNRPTV